MITRFFIDLPHAFDNYLNFDLKTKGNISLFVIINVKTIKHDIINSYRIIFPIMIFSGYTGKIQRLRPVILS